MASSRAAKSLPSAPTTTMRQLQRTYRLAASLWEWSACHLRRRTLARPSHILQWGRWISQRRKLRYHKAQFTGQPDARLGRENAKTQKCDITIPVMSMVGRPSVVRRQKYMTNICDITEPISLTRYRPPSLFPPARATFCGERPDDHRLAPCGETAVRRMSTFAALLCRASE